MAIATAGDIVRAALGKILALGKQDTLAASEAQDGLDSLNALLDSWWAGESLAVYAIRQDSFPMTAGVGTYNIGPAATWNTTRPNRIVNAVATFQSVDYPVTPIDRLQFDAIPYKATQGVPLVLFYDRAYPTGAITLYPIPNLAMTLKLDTYQQIQSFANLTDTIDLPPGYARALIHNLAIELAADYGVDPGATVVKIAAESKGNLKRVNRQDVVAKYDAALVYGSGVYNVFSDTYR